METVAEHTRQVANLQWQTSPTGKSIPEAPPLPSDMFLVMATLLDSAGAYSHFDPADDNPPQNYPPTFRIPDKKAAIRHGQKWAADLLTDTEDLPGLDITEQWEGFFENFGPELVREKGRCTKAPIWWGAALQLLISADEACENIGKPYGQSQNTAAELLDFHVFNSARAENSTAAELADGFFETAGGSSASFSLYGKKEIACVFPKQNISTRGVSHRNFTKNVTLLPKTGSVRCHWHAPQKQPLSDIERTIDILIIPYPYEISGKAFREAGPNHTARAAQEANSERRWANFEIDQKEYGSVGDKDLVDLTEALIRSARKQVDSVNGVIFPEYALDFDNFKQILKNIRVPTCEPNLEFIVAGSSDNCNEDIGNHVLTATWNELSNDESSTPFATVSSRRKHHRWMLDRGQIDGYGLSSNLDPRVKWWENHISGFRELHFYPFREHSLFTTLICEDLARSEPCHEVLKNVGPNLVFSLLMDGPQIINRWPARYADSLSEDISCSVLTVTSLGLIDRANKGNLHKKSEVIAYFSSPFGKREITMPYSSGARGVLLSLTSELTEGLTTIDGREKPHRAWRLASVQPIHPDYTKETEN